MRALFFLLSLVMTQLLWAGDLSLPKVSEPIVDTVRVEGNVQVILMPQSQGPDYEVINNSDPQHVFITLDHHQVHVKSHHVHHAMPTVLLGIRQLNHLIAHGHVFISGENLATDALRIESDSSGQVNLLGMIHLRAVDNTGRGLLSLSWVDGDNVDIRSTAGQISLAGTAHFVTMDVSGTAVLNAGYFRVNTAFVKAGDHGLINMQPVSNMQAFSRDAAQIYYFKAPAYKTRESWQSGNIFQVSDLR